MTRRTRALALLTGTLAACGSDKASVEPAIMVVEAGAYSPTIDPASFSATIDNPFMPLTPGRRWVYAGDGGETVTVEVTNETRVVMGVTTLVVHDVEEVGGEVAEDTYDWFAQDADGNVWYFGEDTTAFDGGEADTEGSWEAGIDGALPGIVMPADPKVSEHGYRQEFKDGEAEDMGQVIAISGRVTTPFQVFDDVIVTRDWTPLEPDVVEQKTYARGVGLVHETKVDGGTGSASLVDFTP